MDQVLLRGAALRGSSRTRASATVDSFLLGADHHRLRTADNRPNFSPVIDDHHSLFSVMPGPG